MLGSLYAKLITLGLVLAMAVGGYMYVSHLQHEVQDLTTQNTVLGAKLKDQNAAIDQIKNDADLRVAAAASAVEAASAAANVVRGQARVIYKTLPSKPGNDCGSALDLLNGVTK
jgi:hypothetical protein